MANLEKTVGNAEMTWEEAGLKKKIRRNKLWLVWDAGFLTYDAVAGIYHMAEGRYGLGTFILACGAVMGLLGRNEYNHLNRNKEALAELKYDRENQHATIDDAVKPEDDEAVLKL